MTTNIHTTLIASNSFRNYYIVIFTLSILIYANTLKHGFVLDDVAVIENNKFVKAGIKGIPDILTTFYWEGYWNSNAGLYRPLSLITFALEYQVSAENPTIHHAFNIFYYALICCLLFEFLCKIFPKIDHRFFLFAVLLFIVHPIHTEVVANIKSRDELFSLLFFLLCCRQLYISKSSHRTKIVLSTLFFLLALLSKEGAIAFIPVLFFIDYLKEKNILTLLKQRIALISTTILWFAWHQYIIVSSSSPKITYTYSDNSLLATSSIIEQKATAFGMFARYIIKAIYPYTLSYDYSFKEIPIISFASIYAMAGLLIFGALLFFAIKLYKTNPLITFCIALIVLPLLLTGNIIFNIGATMGDRFLFIPTIGSCILICLFVFKVFKTTPIQPIQSNKIRFTLLFILLIFSVRTYTRNKDWKDNYTLFKHDVNVTPGSARVHFNNALALEKTNTTNDFEPSKKEYQKCLSIDPYYTDASLNLGSIYVKERNFAEALSVYQKALSKYHTNFDLLGSIGFLYYRKGDIDSSIYYLNKANLAGNTTTGLYNTLGTALFTAQKYPEAIITYEKGIKNDSSNWELYLNYGNALAVSNQFDRALKAFHNSYKLKPDNIQTPYFLALTYLKIGDTLNSDKYLNEYKQLNKKAQ
jgi:tetratricopeptide (TPR) repeat protein